MYILIIIFYASFLSILLMLLLKRHEAKSGRPNLISRAGSSTDAFFHKIFSTVRNTASYLNKHTFVALAHWVAFHILVHIRRIYVDMKSWTLANPHGKKVLDAVRGRGEVRNHGASFYLRRISDK